MISSCCCETTFYCWDDYSITYQMINAWHSPIRDFVYISSAQQILWTIDACLQVRSGLKTLWTNCVTFQNRVKYCPYQRRTCDDAWHCMTFTLIFAWSVVNPFSCLFKNHNWWVVFKLPEFRGPRSSLSNYSCVQEQQRLSDVYNEQWLMINNCVQPLFFSA